MAAMTVQQCRHIGAEMTSSRAVRRQSSRRAEMWFALNRTDYQMILNVAIQNEMTSPDMTSSSRNGRIELSRLGSQIRGSGRSDVKIDSQYTCCVNTGSGSDNMCSPTTPSCDVIKVETNDDIVDLSPEDRSRSRDQLNVAPSPSHTEQPTDCLGNTAFAERTHDNHIVTSLPAEVTWTSVAKGTLTSIVERLVTETKMTASESGTNSESMSRDVLATVTSSTTDKNTNDVTMRCPKPETLSPKSTTTGASPQSGLCGQKPRFGKRRPPCKENFAVKRRRMTSSDRRLGFPSSPAAESWTSVDKSFIHQLFDGLLLDDDESTKQRDDVSPGTVETRVTTSSSYKWKTGLVDRMYAQLGPRDSTDTLGTVPLCDNRASTENSVV